MQHLAHAARRAGRFGDTELVHMNRRELGYLTDIWGEPSTNPHTGLPEFFDFGGLLSWLAPVAASAGAEALGGAGTLGSLGSFFGAGSDWAPTLGGAGIGALTGALTQGLQGKDALMGALGGGALGGAVPSLGKALGVNEFQTPFNIPTLFDVGSGLGGGAQTFGPPVPPSVPEGATGEAFGPGLPPSLPGASSGGASGVGAAASGIGSWLSKNPMAALAAIGALSALSTSPKSSAAPPAAQQQAKSSYVFPTGRLSRTRTPNSNAPMKPGEYNFFQDNQTPDVPTTYAQGGDVEGMGMPGGEGAQGYIQGPGDGRADEIPAKLSNDEYVLDAETMALLGNGSPSAGADKMDQFRANLRKHKGKVLAKGRFSPDAKSVEGYLT